MAHDIESSLGCSHCVSVCSFVVCKPALVCGSICACMEAIHMCNVPPAAVFDLASGAFTPLGVGSGVQQGAK